jgi:hypothetical protein
MTYLFTSTSSTTTLISNVATELSNSGWASEGGGVWSKTSGGKTMRVSGFSQGGDFTAPTYHQVVVDSSINAYFPVTTQLATTGVYYYTISITDDFFYLAIEGPRASFTGAQDATYGSTKAFLLYTTLDTYWSSDTVADDKAVVVRSHSGTTAASWNYRCVVKKGLDAGSWVTAELMTMRPAVQDIASIGDKPPSRAAGSNYSVWPYVVMESASGIRGRLKNVWFSGESYNLAGDSGDWTTPAIVTIDGETYQVERPFAYPNNTAASALGTPTANPTQASPAGQGPIIYIRKGGA